MSPDLGTAWARLFARALYAAGLRFVAVSPGSRSTPLAVALDETPGLRCELVVDERSAGFVALGHARATGAPAAVLCTSGTALAHYAPAVLEASLAYVPLVVLSADRPWEAYDAHAPQTVDQVKLFGAAVRHYAELGLPDEAALEAVPRVAAQALARARGPWPGPVHVNARFRKPLEPRASERREPWHARYEALLERGAPQVFDALAAPDPRGIRAAAALLVRAERPLFVAGPAPGCAAPEGLAGALDALVLRAGGALYAESASGLRHGTPRAPRADALDALLRAPTFLAQAAPDLVLELGLPATSGAYASWLGGDGAAVPRVVLAPYGHPDPRGDAALVLLGPLAASCDALREALPSHRAPRPYGALVAAHSARALEALRGAAQSALREADALACALAAAPEGAGLLVGNSTVVRDLDALVAPSPRALRVLHQRGAAGIDGLLAGAVGARLATGAPTLVALGDVSAAHDAGSLALLRDAPGPLVVLVLDNGGGRIFEQLPVARDGVLPRERFDRLFLTPNALPDGGLAALARAWGVDAVRVASRAALDEALARGFASSRPCVVEVACDGAAGLALRREGYARVAAALAASAPGPERAA